MKEFRRITVIIITALIALAMLSSAAFIAAEADHDCSGEDCAVCCAISACVNIFKSLTAAFTALSACACAFFAAGAVLRIFGAPQSPSTPVTLKTKLLN